MSASAAIPPEPGILSLSAFARLLTRIREAGYTLVGPTVREGAIVLDTLEGAQDLPIGWQETQEAGHYRLHRLETPTYFGFSQGPHAWKKYLHPPRLKLFSAKKTPRGFEITSSRPPVTRYAFLGPRACDLHAMEKQATVFSSATQPDPTYAQTLEQALVVAVSCTRSGGTCFCTSMNTGPSVEGLERSSERRAGYDLALTEYLAGDRHFFWVELGSERGRGLVEGLLSPGTPEQAQQAKAQVEEAARTQTRHLHTEGLREALRAEANSPRWQEIAQRCLSCGSCTLVCPTCFCHSVEDTSDVTGEHAERWRRWDSCFTQDFSYLHGGGVRQEGASRYRQWLTHKLSTWFDQFGSSGCVGCGRCIAWCPVGIDITQEAEGFRLASLARLSSPV